MAASRSWNDKARQSEEQQARYAKMTPAQRQVLRDRMAEKRAERIPMINAIKLERGCIDCGYDAHPAALHFDHRDPATKLFAISKQTTCNMARLMAEIAKCDVRCANCHAVRSVQEGHLGRPRIDDSTPLRSPDDGEPMLPWFSDDEEAA